MQVTVVHNPDAGDGNLGADELRRLLAGEGFAPDFVDAKDPDLARALARPADLVLVAGGDGTVARTVLALPNLTVPVAIVPLGTANNIARTFGVEGDLARILRGLGAAQRRRLDIGFAIGPWGRRRFVEGLGLGALADAMHAAHEREAPSEDRARQAWDELRRALAAAEPHPVEAEVDGRDVCQQALLLEVANIAYVGSGLPLAGHADPGDGQLDIVLVGEAQREAVLAWLDRPEARSPPPAAVARGTRIRFTWGRGQLRLGDEFLDPPDRPAPVELGLEPEAATVLVPPAGGDPDG